MKTGRSLLILAPIVFALSVPLKSEAQDLLEPYTAEQAKLLTLEARDQLGILRAVLQDPQNWVEIKFQPLVLKRLLRIENELLELELLFQQAVDGMEIPAGMAHGDETALSYEYGLIETLISISLIDAASSVGEELNQVFDLMDALLGVPHPFEICDNGIDDDGDGFIDEADPECQKQ